MHGRLKVKTTEEQQEQKRKERQHKLKLFQQGCKASFHKIQSNIYDEEGLQVTQQLLTANSDLSSLWNYRKNAFLYFTESKKPDELKIHYDDELVFLVGCLRNNPKSYGCWNQRCFVLLHMPKPNWKYELELCDMFLEFDERNFHCWDYRRFVVANSTTKIPVEDELKVTEKLIEGNFSNYSSWHYRSKLLPLVYPDDKDCNRIAEKKLLEELELVQNAFFTDPEDQSAWFYHRWLLGRGKQRQDIIAMHWNEANRLRECEQIKFVHDTEQIPVIWKPCIEEKPYQHVWYAMLEPDKNTSISSICIPLSESNTEKNVNVQSNTVTTFTSRNEFYHHLSSSKLEVLKSELDSCQQLNELEPGNKWAVLTLILLMRAINPIEHKQIIQQYLSELEDIDSKRANYYKDMQSRYAIEDYLSTNFENKEMNVNGKNLSTLYHLQYFTNVISLNISKNLLKKIPAEIQYLHCCETINADDNEITDIRSLQYMKQLRKISLKNNSLPISQVQCLKYCSNLQVIELSGNGFTEDDIESLGKDIPNAEITI